MGYNGRWIDSFIMEKVTSENLFEVTGTHEKKYIGKIKLDTPCIRYYLDKEQWREFKEKVNKI